MKTTKTLSSAFDLAAIRNRIALISPTDARLWGSMSVQQMLCHLTDAFCCPLGERAAAPLMKACKGPTSNSSVAGEEPGPEAP